MTDTRALSLRSAKRRQAILDVACDIFLEHGYADSSMSMIVSMVGGSKTTLYGYFPSKEALFTAVVDHQCEMWATSILGIMQDGAPLEYILQTHGERMLEIVLSDKFLALHRLVSGESRRFPHIGNTYYGACVDYGLSRLASVLKLEMKSGRLRRSNAITAAEGFTDMCQSGLLRRRMFNVIAVPDAAEIRAHVAVVTKLFLKAHAGN
jgi:TetR/AcrR family transcriptional repressor of mexJK operon